MGVIWNVGMSWTKGVADEGTKSYMPILGHNNLRLNTDVLR
jgi:hypothetical protein